MTPEEFFNKYRDHLKNEDAVRGPFVVIDSFPEGSKYGVYLRVAGPFDTPAQAQPDAYVIRGELKEVFDYLDGNKP
jgi:hypothetical protein